MEGDKPMIDILIKEKLTDQLINEFLSNVFNTSTNRIILTSEDDFVSMLEMDFSEVDCLCVKNDTDGDAALLLNLYRYEREDKELIHSIQVSCNKLNITCYVPIMDIINGWYKINGIADMKTVKQLESEDQFLFSE